VLTLNLRWAIPATSPVLVVAAITTCFYSGGTAPPMSTRKRKDEVVMGKRVLIVDGGGAACPLFRAALAGVDEMEVYVANNGRQAAALVAGLGEANVVFLDITLPFLALVEFLERDSPSGPPQETPITIVCSQRNAAEIERGLTEGSRAVA
jgi:CheY-like chemotaxis protein